MVWLSSSHFAKPIIYFWQGTFLTSTFINDHATYEIIVLFWLHLSAAQRISRNQWFCSHCLLLSHTWILMPHKHIGRDSNHVSNDNIHPKIGYQCINHLKVNSPYHWIMKYKYTGSKYILLMSFGDWIMLPHSTQPVRLPWKRSFVFAKLSNFKTHFPN